MKLYVVMRKNYKTLFNKCFTLTDHTRWVSEDDYDIYYTTEAFLRKKDAEQEIKDVCEDYSLDPEDFEIVTFEAQRKESKGKCKGC